MNEVFLHNPTYLQLDDTYRSLPLYGSVLVKTSNFEQTLHDFENIGFAAIEILSYSPEEPNQRIRAHKGKHGPCYFTGKKVGYAGYALAALDDDNHLLFKNELAEVCDKTFNIFSLDSYKGLVIREISKTESNESADYEGSGDFESTQARLFDKLKGEGEGTGPRKVLFYPGPFRILILADGSMVYRGKWCSVPGHLARQLIEKERCLESAGDHEGIIAYFQEEYSKDGSACLIRNFNPEVSAQPEYETDFSKLHDINKKFSLRLIDVIDNQRKYFILIGNELEDKLGCCPSEEVTEANRLVKYGILSSLAEPVQGDSCPVTLYAFKDELSASGQGFSSKINVDFRNSVSKILRNSSQSAVKNMLKWVLLAFVVISLGVAARKCQSLQTGMVDKTFFEQLAPISQDQFMLLLFHNQKRCYQCEHMEKYALDQINDRLNFESESLEFKTVIIDDPENVDLVNSFGIFAPTLVLLEFEQKKLVRSKVLPELTGMYREEETFKAKLNEELYQFITEENE